MFLPAMCSLKSFFLFCLQYNGIISFVLSQSQMCLKSVFSGQKGSRKAQLREVGTTFTVILCPLLTYTDLGAERKWQSLQVAKESQVRETADAPVRFKFSVWIHFGFPMPTNEREKKWADKQNICRRCRTVTNKHICSTLLHIFILLHAYFMMRFHL